MRIFPGVDAHILFSFFFLKKKKEKKSFSSDWIWF
jgi:hypothetical protein